MLKQFPASLDLLYEMLEFICTQAKGAGFHTSSISQIELAAEEAIVNIINYGYPSSPGLIEIECNAKAGEFTALEIIIKDQGVPYDPISTFEKKRPTTQRVGGYGVFFILNIMDEVQYLREEGKNILILVKYHR